MATPDFNESHRRRNERGDAVPRIGQDREFRGHLSVPRGKKFDAHDHLESHDRAEKLLHRLLERIEHRVAHGDLTQALRLAALATKISHKFLPAPLFARALETEGGLLVAFGETAAGKQKLLAASEILLGAGAAFSRDAAFALEKLGEIDLQQGQLESATEYYTVASARRQEHLGHLLSSTASSPEHDHNVRSARLELADVLIRVGWCNLVVDPISKRGDQYFEQGCKELCAVQGVRGLWATGKTILRFSETIPGSAATQLACRTNARTFLEKCRVTLQGVHTTTATDTERLLELRVNTHATLGQLYVTECVEGAASQDTEMRVELLQKAEDVLLGIFDPVSPSRQGGVQTAALITLGWVYTLQNNTRAGRAAFGRALECCSNANTSEQQLLNALSAVKGLLRILSPRAPEPTLNEPPLKPEYQPLIGRKTSSFPQLLESLQRHAAHLGMVGSAPEIERSSQIVERAEKHAQAAGL
jgi:hypothetical protein